MVSINDKEMERYLRTPDAARLLGLSPRTLEKHRVFGTGPSYRKLGGRVVYAPEDLRDWAERGKRGSTSDPGTGTVHPAKVIPGITPPWRRKKRRRPRTKSKR